MSGRKASEVSSLLSKGSETRKISIESFAKAMGICEKDIALVNKSYGETYKAMKLCKCEFSKESLGSFPAETNKITMRFNQISSTLKEKSFSLEAIKAENKRLETKVEQLDRKTKEIHSAIRARPHYCDDAYREASGVFQEFKDISNQRNILAQRAKAMSSSANIELSQIINLKNEQDQLLQQVARINQKAAEIEALRQKANEIKDFISKAISDINEVDAKKFMGDTYPSILAINATVAQMNDQEVIRSFAKIEEEIALFAREVVDKKALFEQEKAETEACLNSSKNLLTFDEYYHPMEYFKQGQAATSIDLATFMESYAESKYIKKITDGLATAEEQLKKESFKESKETSEKTRALIEEAIKYGNIKQEQLLKGITLTHDIRTVMRNLKYSASVSIIDDNIANGFKINCVVGDECISFDKVLVDDDGKVTMDIDHTDSATGTCGATWAQLQQEFLNQGIPLQDVTKNGKSVIRKGGTAQQQVAADEKVRSH